MADADIHFYFDPVCPFAWMTSKWVRKVQAQRDYRVDWRFISLRLLNAHIDYAAHFPPEYEAGHTAGLRLLRVAASVRREHGRDAIAPLYTALGTRIFEEHTGTYTVDNTDYRGTVGFLDPVLEELGLPAHHVDALENTDLDAEIQAETDEALALTGRDVGTPIIHFRPPECVAFFGPVISRLPSDEDALTLWDHVIGLASFPGFAELKRSLREKPQLRAFGVTDAEAGEQEDWHGGSRRTQKG
ncbi:MULTISPECIES: mycothiol-dependent nitroreductase Rv2466c family protein [Gordonia]|nr:MULTISPECIES: DsbA family protein [Gordonia]KAF0968081.1 Thioredoxin-like reductase [Gordonia sp. YY1]UOG23224.1 DsbA family protein [Gordonia amicalis]UPW16019.1 DsbA family protein [Gordonia amicalis]